MSTTEPIRNKEQLQEFKDYYKEIKPNLRNCAIIIMGLNTALRISDLLHLTYDEIFQDNTIREHITIRESKTGKQNRIFFE